MKKPDIAILVLVAFIIGYLAGEVLRGAGQDSARQQYIEERMK